MPPCPHAGTLPFLVDGTNVYASRPDGWWRDRRAAAARLIAELDFLCGAASETCIAVFDRLRRGQELPSGTFRVHVLEPAHRGRDAADHMLLTLADASPHTYQLAYTSDRALARALRVRGIRTLGTRALLKRLSVRGSTAGCA